MLVPIKVAKKCRSLTESVGQVKCVEAWNVSVRDRRGSLVAK